MDKCMWCGLTYDEHLDQSEKDATSKVPCLSLKSGFVAKAIEEEKPISISPNPSKKAVVQLSFPDAMKAIIDGKRITRIEWANTDFCLLRNQWLAIYRDGKFYEQWAVSDGDMLATDWIVLEDSN